MILDIAVAIIGGLTCVALIAAALFASRLISFRSRPKHRPETDCRSGAG